MEKIKVRDIREGGIRIEDTIDPSIFELTQQDYLQLIQPVSVKARLRKFETTVLTEIDVATRFTCKCYRTLEQLERDWSDSFTLDYELEPQQEELDLQDDIRQEIILRLPTRVLSDKADEKVEVAETASTEDEDERPDNTYRPFEGLKDLE